MDNIILDKNVSFAKVYQPLNVTATLKKKYQDFIVEEDLSIDFSGDGEHCWIYVRKSGCNTDWVAQQLAAFCDVKKLAVSYAGLKDRNAVTSQWFSVQLPGKPTPDWSRFEKNFSSNEVEKIQVLKSFRHNKKLQRGALKSNSFKLRLCDLSDTREETFELLTQRCDEIAQKGIPNYFGEQRFGKNGNNLDQAIKLFQNPRYKISRHKRGIYLSAARSWMFNHILSKRIKLGVWNRRLAGDVFMLDGKSACFRDDGDDQLEQRLSANEIHPTAILWGEGDVMVTGDAAELESQVIDQFPVYRDGLISARLQAQRRACRLMVSNLESYRENDDFVVSFSLASGSYATMVLAEMFSELR